MTKLSNNEEQRKRYWLADNRGALARIAREENLTGVFVRDVFWGSRTSRSGSVERKLAEMNAPGFVNPIVEAEKGL